MKGLWDSVRDRDIVCILGKVSIHKNMHEVTKALFMQRGYGVLGRRVERFENSKSICLHVSGTE